jgi:hypothetical protein
MTIIECCQKLACGDEQHQNFVNDMFTLWANPDLLATGAKRAMAKSNHQRMVDE